MSTLNEYDTFRHSLIYNMTVCYNYFVVITDITSILKETPNEDELFFFLCIISHKWYDIGLLLQVRRNVLNDLKQSEGFNSVKLKKVIKILKDTNSSSFTWQTVITAMESPVINNKEVADKIRHYLHFSKLLL